jgi:hypothetical protein
VGIMQWIFGSPKAEARPEAAKAVRKAKTSEAAGTGSKDRVPMPGDRGSSATPATVACSKCAGTASVTCDTCNGARKFRCRSCGGGGKVGSGNRVSNCSNCGGSGSIQCDDCNGMGKFPCRACGGKGVVQA